MDDRDLKKHTLRRECSEKFENEIDDPLAETLKPIRIAKAIAMAPWSR
jgi:hypothetical protein